MGRLGRIVVDGERRQVHLCGQKRGTKEGSPKLEDSCADHVGDEFSHFGDLCERETVVGESND